MIYPCADEFGVTLKKTQKKTQTVSEVWFKPEFDIYVKGEME